MKIDRFKQPLQLWALPDELVQDIFERLSKPDLANLNLTSQWTYRHAAPLLWGELELVDTRKLCGPPQEIWTLHGPVPDAENESRDEHDDGPLIRKLLIMVMNPWLASQVHSVTHRCHLPPPAIFHELPFNTFSGQTLSCDPRTIHLVTLAAANMTNVHTLRIILGHASLNDALIRCFFDSRRRQLGCVPVRRLWLENCRVNVGCCTTIRDGHPSALPSSIDFTGLESVRFRRLPISATTPLLPEDRSRVYSRRWRKLGLLCQDGSGGLYFTSLDKATDEVDLIRRAADSMPLPPPLDHAERFERHLLDQFSAAMRFDDHIYEQISREIDLPADILRLGSLSPTVRAQRSFRGTLLDPSAAEMLNLPQFLAHMQREQRPSSMAVDSLLTSASATLTSLNLDWVLTQSESSSTSMDDGCLERFVLFSRLFACRFPSLRAFQVRNCVVHHTALPPGLFLFDHSVPRTDEIEPEALKTIDTLAALKFMEAHPKLQCLAWPIDHFYSERGESNMPANLLNRVRNVVDNLGRTLIDLRVEALYTSFAEPHAAEIDWDDEGSRQRRRRFIENFAARMTKLTSVKIEGCVARDERRETIRALHACPLSKIVMIGVCSPLGNTWGAEGADAGPFADDSDFKGLDSEDEDSVFEFGTKLPSAAVSSDSSPAPTLHSRSSFQAMYGWPPSPPLLHTIASLHAATVKELKFCGYKGAPVLFDPTPITTPLLFALRSFHALESLVLSLWLPTFFETSHRDAEIISYWMDPVSPSSTALVPYDPQDGIPIPNPDPFHIDADETDLFDDLADHGDNAGDGDILAAIIAQGREQNRWARALRSRYAPAALAQRITDFIGPHLSPVAKRRESGVHVRASFCVGDCGGIFDVDLRMRTNGVGRDVCIDFQGPRSEIDEGRRRGKLDARRWF